MGTTTRTVTIPERVNPVVVLGSFDSILRLIEDGFPTLTFVVRGRAIEIVSHSAPDENQAMQARDFLTQIVEAADRGQALDREEIKRLLDSRDVHSRDVHETPDDVTRDDTDTKVGNQPEFDDPYRAAKHSYFSTSVRAARHKLQQRNQRDHQDRTGGQQVQHSYQHAQHDREQDWRVSNQREVRDVRRDQSTLKADIVTDGGDSQPLVISHGQPVRPKTAGQRAYVTAISRNTITFGIGPAGTGKTYLAVAKAVQAFETRQVRRIILTRPAVEAGENLGFLPGTLNDKIDPYLRPLYDALSDMLGAQRLHEEMEDGSIEVAPLAYMRGRTLNDAFVILDEAQNTTEQQMKMFLTRLGFNTKMVVTGDATQVDLAVHRSGLRTIEKILAGIDSITFVHLSSADVVRHELVGKIVSAYNRHDEQLQQARRRVREGQDR